MEQYDINALNDEGVQLDTNVKVTDNRKKPNPPPATTAETITGAKRQTEYEDVQITIVVKADGIDSSIGTGGRFDVTPSVLEPKEDLQTWTGQNGKVESFAKLKADKKTLEPASKGTKLTYRPTVTLQIFYGSKEDAWERSAYGRGTGKDEDTNDTSLGFHENCHLQAALTFFKDDAKLPKFGAKFGDKEDAFVKALDAWKEEISNYWKKEEKASKDTVDETGKPTLKAYKAAGNTAGVH